MVMQNLGKELNKVHYGLCGNVEGFQRVQSTWATAGIEKKAHATPGKSLQSGYQLNKKYVLSFYYNIYSAK